MRLCSRLELIRKETLSLYVVRYWKNRVYQATSMGSQLPLLSSDLSTNYVLMPLILPPQSVKQPPWELLMETG